MDKGTRVTITGGSKGKGKGVSGTIFWKGANKWGPGERFGIRGDDGETYWVADADVEPTTTAAPPVPEGPTFQKGDRVRFVQRGEKGTGTVFWIGDSRSGPGQRLGIRNDEDEEAVWLDARFAEALEDSEPAPAARGQEMPSPHLEPFDDGDAASEVPWSPPLDMDELPPPAPWDDADIGSLASEDEEPAPPWEG